jgi:ABC-type transport system involved in multi-copper enzyme maturation permease subunit
MIYLNLDIGRKRVEPPILYFVHLPFSLYLGWITVATIANITAVLVHYQWSGWGLSEVFWTVLVVFAGTVITFINILQRGDIAYSVVILWAYLGIIIKRYSASGSPIMAIIYMTGIGMLLIVIGLLFFRKRDVKA